ncbi:hypothetical protein CHS0354_032217 [Potamilus streckersoni]|uniref:Uncharacterized protein n=1 Tax=Potamilus streckersoni TaxID=2493646 RepID=A0AAE0RMG2_9BIVA|nr:hypothetical protein CHS0354_032217 [Potamilus streckersoni]
MDFHAAMETFAEAWVAANTQTAVNTDPQNTKHSSSEDLPTLVSSPSSGKNKAQTKHPPGPSQTSPSATNTTKSLPIHCIIEQTPGPPSFEAGSTIGQQNTVELDSYAILPGTTLLNELVRAALIKLGYTSTEAMAAKGAIQIKNWKPLSFDNITDNTQATLDEILGELTQVATLRIRLPSVMGDDLPATWTDNTVRCAIFFLLKEMNQSTLAKLCPLSQSAISNISNWKYNKLSADKCQKFGEWFRKYQAQKIDFDDKEGFSKDTRLTFHPDHELPLMRHWYKTCKTPTIEKLKFFAEELNKGHVRQERPKVTVIKLKMWWKNERQREKRLEQKRETQSTSQTDNEADGAPTPVTQKRLETSPSIASLDEQSNETENDIQMTKLYHGGQDTSPHMSQENFDTIQGSLISKGKQSAGRASQMNQERHNTSPMSPASQQRQYFSILSPQMAVQGRPNMNFSPNISHNRRDSDVLSHPVSQQLHRANMSPPLSIDQRTSPLMSLSHERSSLVFGSTGDHDILKPGSQGVTQHMDISGKMDDEESSPVYTSLMRQDRPSNFPTSHGQETRSSNHMYSSFTPVRQSMGHFPMSLERPVASFSPSVSQMSQPGNISNPMGLVRRNLSLHSPAQNAEKQSTSPYFIEDQ